MDQVSVHKRVEFLTRKSGTLLSANLVNRVKTAFASAFATPSLALVVA